MASKIDFILDLVSRLQTEAELRSLVQAYLVSAPQTAPSRKAWNALCTSKDTPRSMTRSDAEDAGFRAGMPMHVARAHQRKQRLLRETVEEEE